MVVQWGLTMRALEGGRASGFAGVAPARAPELSAEERAAVERRDAAFEVAARQALEQCIAHGKAPEGELGRTQLLWARMRAPHLLQQAETRGRDSEKAAGAQQQDEQQQRRAGNADRVALLVANLRAAATQAIPLFE